MSGGNGPDRFRWFQPTHGGDRITDFDPRQDVIELQGDNFGGGLQSGPLNPSQFTLGTAALDSGDRVIYHKDSGQLFFDPDGVGGNNAVLIASFNGNPSLSVANFHIL
jgi:Ca2+-binding RTX toxin-like protein